jgi:hypothetical protein
MSVLPWKGAIVEPDEHPPIRKEVPDVGYEIEFAYGVRTEEVRKHVHFNYKGDVVYMTAALGVINHWTKTPATQTIFGGGEVDMKQKGKTRKQHTSHNDDIYCLQVSRDRQLVVSG